MSTYLATIKDMRGNITHALVESDTRAGAYNKASFCCSDALNKQETLVDLTLCPELTYGEYYQVDGSDVYCVSVKGNGVHVWVRVRIKGSTFVYVGSSPRISKVAQYMVCHHMTRTMWG